MLLRCLNNNTVQPKLIEPPWTLTDSLKKHSEKKQLN